MAVEPTAPHISTPRFAAPVLRLGNALDINFDGAISPDGAEVDSS